MRPQFLMMLILMKLKCLVLAQQTPLLKWQHCFLDQKRSDDKLSKVAVNRMLEPFRELASESDFLMTNHVLNSSIDKENVVTFSPEWIRILREDVKYDGLIMTDGIFMFNKYPDSIKKMAAQWPQDQVRLTSLYKEGSDLFVNANYGNISLCENPKFEAWAKKAEEYLSNSTSRHSYKIDRSSKSRESSGVQ